MYFLIKLCHYILVFDKVIALLILWEFDNTTHVNATWLVDNFGFVEKNAKIDFLHISDNVLCNFKQIEVKGITLDKFFTP